MTEIEAQCCREAKERLRVYERGDRARMDVGKWKVGVTAKRWSQSAIPETPRLRNSDLTYHPKPWVEQRLLA